MTQQPEAARFNMTQRLKAARFMTQRPEQLSIPDFVSLTNMVGAAL